MKSLPVCQIRHSIKSSIQYAVSIQQDQFIFQFYYLSVLNNEKSAI